jgi:hypothetical protein
LMVGHADGSGGRLWPTSEWVGGSVLAGDPAAVDGTETTISHADFRGNVPAPVQLFVGVEDEVPHPLYVGYKREGTVWGPYANAEDANFFDPDVTLGTLSDPDAIGGSVERWYPETNTLTDLMSWRVSDATPPGRDLVVLRVSPSSTAALANFAFRAWVRLADDGVGGPAALTGGTYDLDLSPAPEWFTSAPGYGLWPLGVLPLPAIQRLARRLAGNLSYRFGLSGIYTGTPIGGAFVDIDGAYFLPLDGFYRGLASPNNARATGVGSGPYIQVTIDGITPVPGGLYSAAYGEPALTLPTNVVDRPDAQDDGIAVGEFGKFVLISAGVTHDKSRTLRVAMRYRPRWTTAGGAS